jgi:RES domain-containing protein
MTPKYAGTSNAGTGEGGFITSGRWNPSGCFRLLNTSETPELALLEVQSNARYYGLPIAKGFPRVVAIFDFDLLRVQDLGEQSLRRALGVTLLELTACDFRSENKNGREALTQAVGRAAFDAKLEGLWVPSAQRRRGRNLLAFPENRMPQSSITGRDLDDFDKL